MGRERPAVPSTATVATALGRSRPMPQWISNLEPDRDCYLLQDRSTSGSNPELDVIQFRLSTDSDRAKVDSLRIGSGSREHSWLIWQVSDRDRPKLWFKASSHRTPTKLSHLSIVSIASGGSMVAQLYAADKSVPPLDRSHRSNWRTSLRLDGEIRCHSLVFVRSLFGLGLTFADTSWSESRTFISDHS